jgi:hypothetical protein
MTGTDFSCVGPTFFVHCAFFGAISLMTNKGDISKVFQGSKVVSRHRSRSILQWLTCHAPSTRVLQISGGAGRKSGYINKQGIQGQKQ